MRLRVALSSTLFLLAACALCEARVGDFVPAGWWQQTARFWSLQDGAVRTAVAGGISMGIACGTLGSFMVVRRLSLVGDMVSHAVLPGVVVGFLWGMSKDPLALFIGATVAGLLGIAAVQAIGSTTRIHEDSVLGMVLAGFYAVGVCLLTMTQKLETAAKAGLDQFLFGQAAALAERDVLLMTVLTLLAVLLVGLFYKELLVDSFDPLFARIAGLPVKMLRGLLLFLLTVAIVVSLQAAGVVLVSALLIIPAATAYLLVRRMQWLIVLAAAIGALSAVGGAYFSFLRPNLPTGPFIILTATAFFSSAFLAAPGTGLVWVWLRRRRNAFTVGMENTLKTIYYLLEEQAFRSRTAAGEELALRLNKNAQQMNRWMQRLERRGWVRSMRIAPLHRQVSLPAYELTVDGWQQALQIVRNHRLWELYLTTAARYDESHVHDDAEKMEHLLPQEVVLQLDERLGYPLYDPHGRLIPTAEDVSRGQPPQQMEGEHQ